MFARAAALVLVLGSLASLRAHAGVLDELKPGQWYEVPSSQLRAVRADSKQFPWVAQGEGISGIINDWCGGAFDTKRDRLYVGPCGGHNGYFGNEVYGFDLSDLKWRRLTDPMPIVTSECPEPSQYPCAIHTYDGIDYAPPPVDRLIQVGGWQAKNTYALDPEKLVWEVRSPSNQGRTGDVSAWDPVTRLLWVQFNGTAGTGKLCTWDPVKDLWTERSGKIGFSYYKTATIDYRRRKMIAVGHSEPLGVVSWTLSADSTTIKYEILTTTGATEITSAGNPGLEYDPVSDRIVAWNGGQNVYALDLDAKVWTRHAGQGADPGPRNPNGTYGRFRYVPSKNVFVVVSSVDKNVFIYKHAPGSGVAANASPDGGGGDSRPADASQPLDFARPVPGAGGAGADAGSPADASALGAPSRDGGGASPSGPGAGTDDDGAGDRKVGDGCSCDVAARRSGGGGLVMFFLLVTAVTRRGRRRTSPRPTSPGTMGRWVRMVRRVA